MSGTHDIVQGLWIGSRLSALEQLSISSFLAHGHIYHLYAYEPLDNVPEGTVVKDANEILPAGRIFRYPNGGSFAGFSDFFRFKLLLERGNWWVDTDMVCLRPFDFPDPIVICSDRSQNGCRSISTGVLKFPAGSAAMATATRICDLKDPASLVYCEIGPDLIKWLVPRFSLEPFVQEPEVFCPIPWHERASLAKPGGQPPVGAYALHLWNEALGADRFDKDGRYPAGSLYERLKSAYLQRTA